MLLVRKENDRYFLSGGLEWIPLPEKIKTRSDLENHIRRSEFRYASKDFKQVNYYEVYWLNHDPKLGMSRINESSTRICIPPNGSMEEIITHLQNHAKKSGLGAEVVFMEKLPEMVIE